MKPSVPAAIVGAGALIAAAVLIAGHWKIVPAGYQDMAPLILMLDRWTGGVRVCVADETTVKNDRFFVGAKFICEVK